MRPILAISTFFRVLFRRPLSPKLLALSAGPSEEDDDAPESEGLSEREAGAVQLLALLQREGRLVDFLTEDISAFQDAQVGAAVRSIHKGCKDALQTYFEIDGVREEEEDSALTIERGFDPSALRVTGNLPEEGDISGVLRHRGWRAVSVKLPEPLASQDPAIIEAAELEVE